MSHSNFNPWWYYEMGKTSAERSRQSQKRSIPARTQRTAFGVGLVVFWVFLTLILSVSVVIYAFASLFLDWEFWLCLVVSGLFSFWLCSLFVR